MGRYPQQENQGELCALSDLHAITQLASKKKNTAQPHHMNCCNTTVACPLLTKNTSFSFPDAHVCDSFIFWYPLIPIFFNSVFPFNNPTRKNMLNLSNE